MKHWVVALCCLFLGALSACSQQPADIVLADTIKIVVREQGLYRLPRSDLRAVGFPVSALNSGLVQLSESGQAVPLLVDEEGVVFYGRQSSNRYTPYRTYILRAGERGREMEEITAPSSSEQATMSVIRRTLLLERNLEYIGDAREENSDQGPGPWFWQTIGLGQADPIAFDLPEVASGSGTIHVRLVGTTLHPTIEPDHNVSLYLNDQELALFSWDGQTSHIGTLDVASGSLNAGANRIRLSVGASEHLDISKLDWIEVVYDAYPRTNENYLAFSSGPGVVSLEGFGTVPLVVDVTDPDRPLLLGVPGQEQAITPVELAREGQYIAAAAGGFLSPVFVEPLQTGPWAHTQLQADLLIVAPRELSEAMEPLVAARAEQGLSAVVVPLEDIYDGFGHGAATPQSINRFVSHVVENWQEPTPRYLLLVGDATIDYWGFLGQRDEEPVSPPEYEIPSMLVPVHFGGETISDGRLADVDGDYEPDLAVGRWPVGSKEAVRALIERTLRYESTTAPQNAIFAVDGSSGEFERLTDAIISHSEFPRDGSQVLVGPTAGDLVERWREGAWLVTYAGHGSLRLWSDQEMLTTADVPSLQTPGVQPIVLQLTCLTGLFAHPEITSLSETMLTGEDGPAIIIAATSLTISAHQQPFASGLLAALQDPSVGRIGDALRLARQSLDLSNAGLREVNDTFVLLGDPSTTIVRP